MTDREETDREEAGLRRLKQDLDEAQWPSPELLARYATQPNALGDEDKRIVEQALASSAILTDELATLRGFDFSKLDADRREAPATASEAGLGGWLRRLARTWLSRPPVWIAATAVLALVFWLAQSEQPIAPAESPPQLAEHAPAAPAPSRPTPPDGPDADRHAPSPALPTPEATRIADQRPAPPRATPVEIDPSGSQAVAAKSTPAPIPAPAPQSDPSSSPSPTQAEPQRGEILLAMAMPDYHPAYGIEPQSSAEWIVRGGGAGEAKIETLAPPHVTRACSASPILHWSINRVPARGELFLTIVDAGDEPIVVDHPLARPARAGLQRLDLASARITLPTDRILRWSVALRADDAGAPTAFDFGWLRVEAPDTAAAAALAGRGDETRAAGYAELGCYSEALEAALVARSRHPDDPAPRRAVERLARQAGLDAALVRD